MKQHDVRTATRKAETARKKLWRRPNEDLDKKPMFPRDEANVFKRAVEILWRLTKDKIEGAGLTRLFRDIARTLADWKGAVVRHRDLARVCHCDKRSVVRALKWLHTYGLLSWSRRVLYCVCKWRAQIANDYTLLSQEKISFYRVLSWDNLSPPGIRVVSDPAAGSPRDLLDARIKAHTTRQRAIVDARQGTFPMFKPA